MKKKVILIVVVILLVTSILIGISYAYYIFNVSQSSSNIVRTDCFEITYTDGNAINLTNTIPLTDREARDLDPYTFTIKNICNQAVDYSVNIETLEGSTMDLDAVSTKLDGRKKQILGSIEDNSNLVNSNATSSKTIYSNILKAGEEKTYNLRLWVDEDATIEQSMSKTFSSRVVVSGVLHPNYSEAVLINGEAFNKKIKELAGTTDPSFNTENTNIISIQRSLTAPNELTNYVNVASSSSTNPIYAWFDNGTIYLYSESAIMKMNLISSYMFSMLKGLTDIDLSYMNTSGVNNMEGLFYNVSALEELDVGDFDTSNVTNMNFMFGNMDKIKSLDLSGFNTWLVMDMSNMFTNDSSLEYLDVSSFDTSLVGNMQSMFNGNTSLKELDISNFRTSAVTNMSFMFNGCAELEYLDVSNFDTGRVTDMSNMFSSLPKLKSLDVSSLNTANVTNMNGMFSGLKSITSIDLSNFNTSKVTKMSSMFSYIDNLKTLDLSNFDTKNVTSMYGMFSNSTGIENVNLTSFDTSNVTIFSEMFAYTNFKLLDLSSFNTSSASSVSKMFYCAYDLKTVYVSNLWNLSNVSNDGQMMQAAYEIVGGAGTTFNWNYINSEYARIDDPDNGQPGYFTLKTN